MGSGVILGIIAFVLYALFFTTGTILIALGVRGRLVVSPPRCASCGQRIARGELERSGRCPECGSSIGERGGVRYLRRRRNTGLIASGIGIGALCVLAPLAIEMVGGLMASNPASVPTPQLIALLESGPSDEGSGTIFELERRIKQREVGTAELGKVVEALIVWHERQPRHFLMSGAGAIVAAADQVGVLTQEQMRRLGDAVFERRGVHVPPTARENCAFDLDVPADETRGDLARTFRIESITEGGTKLVGDNPQHTVRIALSLSMGRHVIRITSGTAYHLVGTTGGSISTATPPRFAYRGTDDIPIEVVAANAPPFLPLVNADATEAKRSQVRDVLKVHRVAVDHDSSDGSCIARGDIEYEGGVDGMTLSFDVLLRVGGTESVLGSMRITRRGGTTSTTSWLNATRLPCPPGNAPVAIVFRPNLLAPERDPTVQPVWNEEFVFESMPVVRNSIGPIGGTQ